MTRHDPHPMAPRRPVLLLLLTVVLGAALALGACKQEQEGQAAAEARAAATTEAATAPPAKPKAPAAAPVRAVVEVKTLQPRDFTLTGTYVGYLVPNERVELRSEIEGVAESVRFDESDDVKRGQLLAEVSTAQLRVRRDQAKADLALAESNFKRESTLHAQKLLPDSQMEQTRTRLDQARLALKLAQIELNKSRVRSPINGTVKTRGVDPGEFLNKGQLVAEVLDVSKVRALLNVPEREVRHITPGRPVTVTFEALPDLERTGAVRTIGLEADLKSRTFPVEVELDNADRRLRPGMLARASVALQHFRNQVLVPRYAILEREQGPVVFVARDGIAEERPIKVGAGADGEVQVLSGLEPGEKLVVTGFQKLIPGEPIEVHRTGR